MTTRERFTTTLPLDTATALKGSADKAGIPMNTILEDALQLYWGTADAMLEGRRQLVIQALKLSKKRAA